MTPYERDKDCLDAHKHLSGGDLSKDMSGTAAVAMAELHEPPAQSLEAIAEKASQQYRTTTEDLITIITRALREAYLIGWNNRGKLEAAGPIIEKAFDKIMDEQ